MLDTIFSAVDGGTVGGLDVVCVVAIKPFAALEREGRIGGVTSVTFYRVNYSKGKGCEVNELSR